MRAFLVALASTLVLACSSEPAPGGPSDAGIDAWPDALPDAGPADTGDSAPAPFSFSSCTLLTDPSHPPVGPRLDGIASAMAECATATAPAVWTDPNGDTIGVFVKRYPAAQQPAKGQLWLLMGGPGNAGSDLEAWAFSFAKAVPTLDLYLPDHRGTGRSAFATCGPFGLTPAAAAGCAATIAHLEGLTTTGAARDLASLIDLTRAPQQQVFVYGMSYGTYWAQRYLEIRPDQPTAVILDSTIPANGMDFAEFDKHFDDKAHAVLELCKTDTTCSTKLGPDPVAKAKLAIAADDAVTCFFGIRRSRELFGLLVDSALYFERMLLPATVYRALRCNSADVAWLAKVQAHVSDVTSTPIHGFSNATNLNVIFSELWPNNPSVGDLRAEENTMLAYAGGPPYWASLAPSWPKAPHDAYYGTWPSSPAPTLVLQGTADAQTPFGDVVKPHYSGSNQYFVELPNANHVVVGASPMVDPNARSCGEQVTLSFLADPSKAPDTSCIAGMAPLDFGHPPAQWLAAVGIEDLWENPE